MTTTTDGDDDRVYGSLSAVLQNCQTMNTEPESQTEELGGLYVL